MSPAAGADPRRGAAAASGPRARLPSRQTLLALLLFVLAGLGFGAALAPWALATLAQPTAVDEGRWTVLVPGMDEQVMSPNLGRGSQIAAGRLTLVPHSFGRADRLLPRDPRPLSRLEIDLDPRSGPLVVNLVPPAGAGAGILNLKLRPGAWSDPSGKPVEIPKDEAAVLLFEGGRVLAETPAGPVALATQPAGSVELSAHAGPAFLRRFRALDTQGELVLEEDWSRAPLPDSGRLKSALGGGLLGLLVGAVALGARRRDLGLLLGLGLLLPALLTLLLPHALWLNLVERLFLVRTSTWELAEGVFAVALLPLLGAALLRSGLFAVGPPQRGELPWPAWLGAAVVVTAAGARGLDGPVLLALPLGVAFLCLPLRLSQAAELSRNALLVRDLPTFAAIALLGWAQGLLPALLWRLLLILGLVPALVDKAPRAGTDLLFLTLLLLPVSAELAVRSSYLERGWSVEHLSGAELGAGEDATGVAPYWSAGCGEDRREIWWFGGSSAGGAYQLGGEPEAFFPGQVHAALCARGLGVETVNYANGGRDSFTFSRAIDALLAEGSPDLVVVYVGVNDILTENSSKTRKQREAARAARTADSSRWRAWPPAPA